MQILLSARWEMTREGLERVATRMGLASAAVPTVHDTSLLLAERFPFQGIGIRSIRNIFRLHCEVSRRAMLILDTKGDE